MRTATVNYSYVFEAEPGRPPRGDMWPASLMGGGTPGLEGTDVCRIPAGNCATPENSACEEALLLGRDVEVGRRVGRILRRQDLDQEARHGPVAVPLAVGRHHVPGRRLRAPGQRLVVGRPVVVPFGPLVDVCRIVFPVFRRILEPFGQAVALLLGRDVE